MYKVPHKILITIRILTIVAIFFAVISTIATTFNIVFVRTKVNGYSMYPTLNSQYESTSIKDTIYINRFNKGKVGDIVVLDLRSNEVFASYTIKRIIAIEGDIVNIVFDEPNLRYNLVVNDKVIQTKPYSNEHCNTYIRFQSYVAQYSADQSRISKDASNNIQGVIVKTGEVYVLGDNWNVSKDSSQVGPLYKKDIVGRVDIVVEPNQNELLAILKGIF